MTETPKSSTPQSAEVSETAPSPPLLHQSINLIKYLLIDPAANVMIAPFIVVLTSLFSRFIIYYVPYTEIDFSTYMQQIGQINHGEIDYSLIGGDTGAIVYPAGYVQIYQVLALLTQNGADLTAGQNIFSLLLTVTNALVVIIYMTSGLPPWPLYLLLCSKRLFSIYVLRLFNDCFTTFCMCGVVLLLQQAAYWKKSMAGISYMTLLVASDLFSIAISIKMNAILYLPAFVIIIYFLCDENIIKMILPLLIIPLIQICVGWRFLLPLYTDEDAVRIRWNYINGAFNFGRKFMYKWTVNWRFIDEETFLSDEFSDILLLLHVLVLLIFIFTRFVTFKSMNKSVLGFFKDALVFYKSTVHSNNIYIDESVSPFYIMLVMSISNVIGVLFSRSLHYQFLSWYCWQLPFLLFATGWSFLVCIPLFLVHELCWNAYPSTNLSSACLVSILSVVLFGVWKNKSNWERKVSQEVIEKKNK